MWERNQIRFTPIVIGLVVTLASCVLPDGHLSVSDTPTVALTSRPSGVVSGTPTPTHPTLNIKPTTIPLSLQGTSIPFTEDVITLDNIDQVVQLARWGNGIPNQVEHSPDGKYLAIASTVGIFLYETETYSQIGSFENYPNGVSVIKFSPDGKLLATVMGKSLNGAQFEIISIPDGDKVSEIYEDVKKVAFSPDGKRIAIAVCAGEHCSTPIIKIFNSEMKLLSSFEESGRPGTLIFSPDGKLLGVQTQRIASIWVLEKVESIFQYGPAPIQSTPFDLAFSPNGEQFAIGTYSDIRMYSTGSSELLHTMKEDNQYRQFFCVEFSPDGNLLAVGGSSVYLLKVSDGTLIDTFDRDPIFYPGVHTDISWSLDGNKIITATNFEPQQNHNSVLVWSVSRGELEQHIEGFSGSKGNLAWMPDGNMLAVSTLGYNTLVQVLNGADGTPEYSFYESLSAVYTFNLSFSHNSSTLDWKNNRDYVFFRDVVDTSSGEESTLVYSPFSITFSTDGQYFAIADYYYSGDNPIDRISILDTDNGEVIQSWDFDNDGNDPYDLEFGSSSNNLYALLINYDEYTGDVLRLDVDTGSLETLDINTSKHVQNLSISPDEKNMALVSLRGGIDIIHEMEATAVLSDLRANTVEWSPNGNLMVVPSRNGIIYILDSKDGSVISSLYGHTESVNDLKFSPDGSLFASTSSDGTIRLWGIP